MKGDEKVVSVLNQVPREELTAINQHFHSRQHVQELGLRAAL
jgi:bacterioferritin (cytochrome b1)